MRSLIIAASLTAACAAAPAAAQRIDWRPGEYRLVGAGVRDLYPELRGTERGRAFVMRNFDANRDGRVNRYEAADANRAFERRAGADRGRFDWGRAARADAGEPVLVNPARGYAMRQYAFRDTAEGARFALAEEVLFATDSDRLRPGALDRLEPLADWLRDNPRVRVLIDGHADARASASYNRDLSTRRAEAVRAALQDMGGEGARYRVRGFGETRPVADDASAAGRRLNRRVEVTLVGRRAAEFAGR